MTGGLGVIAAGAVACGLIAGGWRPLSRVEVRGDSMRPAFEPGDRLVLVKDRRARPGDVVTVTDPRQPGRTVLKRVAARDPGGLTVLGDNHAASTDSRTWGPVAPSTVGGRAVYRYFPDSRRGLL